MVLIDGLIRAATDSNVNFDVSTELITILSLIFTLISITISVAEYFLSKSLLKANEFVMIELEVECKDFERMSRDTFRDRVIFENKYHFVAKIARTLKLPQNEIEFLKPIHTAKGAMFAMNIEGSLANIKTLFELEIQNQSVQKVKFLLVS